MDKTLALKIAKQTVKIVASISVSTVVYNVVKATTPLDTTGVSKALVVIGGVILSNMISDKATDYVMNFLGEVGGEAPKVIVT